MTVWGQWDFICKGPSYCTCNIPDAFFINRSCGCWKWDEKPKPKCAHGSHVQPPTFDYLQNGHVFLQDGTIYYSPNCSRLAVIPPHTVNTSSPFNQPRLNASVFKQPIWWSEFFGWLRFILLAPSFTSAPFTLFSWMPRIEKVEVTFHLPSGLEAKQTRFKKCVWATFLSGRSPKNWW